MTAHFDSPRNDIPPRSLRPPVLHQLLPEGVGGPASESLHSYMQRLARSHQVTLYQLTQFVCSPRGEFKEQLRLPLRLDSTCENVWKFTQRLAKLTQVPSVELVGLAWLHGKVARNEKLKDRLAWCPACLLDSRAAGKPECGQSSWLFINNRECVVHRTPLVDACPQCNTQKDPRPLFEDCPIATCGSCAFDLARPDDGHGGLAMRRHGRSWETYAAQQIGDLIAQARVIAATGSSADIARLYASAIQRERATSARRLSGLAGASFATGKAGAEREQLPTIDVVLRLAIAADVSLAGVFCPRLWVDDHLGVPLGFADGQDRKRGNRIHDWNAINASVRQRLRAGEDISISLLSEQLAVEPAVLVSKLGELAHEVTRHSRQIIERRRQQEVNVLIRRLEALQKKYSYFQQTLSMSEASRETGVSKDSAIFKRAWRAINTGDCSARLAETLFELA